MSERPSAENDLTDLPRMGGGSYTEYGVLVDNRAQGLGVRLAEVTRDINKAESVAAHYRELEGVPVGVRSRRVHVTDWERPAPPADGGTR